MWTVTRGADLVRVAWRNGQGTTRDVVTRAGPDGALLWQVSIADLERDADFSDFSGFDRVFTPIAGGPVELSFNGARFTPRPALVPVPFAGQWRTQCRVASPAQALNAITDRHVHAATVDVLHIAAGGSVETAEAAECVLHCWSGVISLDDARLQPGDSSFGPGGSVWAALDDAVVLRVMVR